MLIEFRVGNFLSFRDEETLSLVASTDSSLPSNVATFGVHRLLRTAAVYGPNASGKSNLIKAVSFMRGFVRGSAGIEGDDIGPAFRPFALDTVSAGKPSLFEVTFLLDGIRYQYGFTLFRGNVQEEWLIAYPRGRAQRWFDRGTDSGTGDPTWKWGASFKGEKSRLAELTRKNALFLSVAAKLNHPQISPVYEWFSKCLRVLGPRQPLRPVTASMLGSEGLEESGRAHVRRWVLAFLKDADLGVTDVHVEKRQRSEEDLPDEVRGSLSGKVLKEVLDRPIYDVQLLHLNVEADEQVPFSLAEESDGTQRLFELAGPWLQAIAGGYTVFVDELEASLHPLLTRQLVGLFQDSDTIGRGAQLIFATHDTTLLDPELLRRDQVWFTEKDQAGATHLYSLQDYKRHRVRKGEALQKGYLSGRYGAIPVLGAFDLK